MRFSVTSSPRVHFSVTSSPRVRFSVTSSPRVRFSVECAFPHLGKRDATSRKSAFSNQRLTEKRILGGRAHGKVQSAVATRRKSTFCTLDLTEKRILQPAPHGKAHSATQQSPRVRLSVRVRPRVRFSVECVFPHLGKRGGASRKSAFSNRSSTAGASRKSALCNRSSTAGVTEKRSLRPTPHEKHTLRSPDEPSYVFL